MELRLTLVFAVFIAVCVFILWPRKRKKLRGHNSAGASLEGMQDIGSSHGGGDGGGGVGE